ncbi:hypothetical protein SUGI_0226970 [Cryptomeria japonica]|nr:hypothetical protein SUGI_0226970 [Cryptomeria japonica]
MNNLEGSMNCKGQIILLLIFTSFILATFSSNELQYHNQIDVEALLELKNSVKVDPSLSLSSWANGNNICNWTGITCDRNQRVVSLVLKYRGLAGTIPPHIGNMSFLTMLDLSYNYFSAHIPQELGKLQKLQYIKLYENILQGPIPGSMSACTNLLELRLNNNLLSGSIPPELSSLYNLKKLDISSNKLSGIIPQGLANCTLLKRLDLGHNNFTGIIPRSISNCTKLRVLHLKENALEGPIPSEILTSMTRLHYLRLNSNKLNGSISMEIGKLWRLRVINFRYNSLTGSIPMVLANCSSLETLALASNSLYGTVPPELSSLNRLQELWLSNNSLGGSIHFVMNYTELKKLSVGGNKFEGTIPEVIGNKLPKLQVIELTSNQLRGSIPKSLANCSALHFFSVFGNNLSGEIPQELGALTRLQTLQLGVNSFEGYIFPFPLNCTELQVFELTENGFLGSIPGDIGLKLPNLQIFYAAANQFRGVIPNSLGNCSLLSILVLAGNQLSGAVPQELGMLTALQRLYLGFNSLSNGHCGIMCALDVFSNCSILEHLYLSENDFSGTLSRSIGNLSPRLSKLYLDGNNITGNIPEEIGNLTELTLFDLSYTNVIGQVPSALGRLKNLQLLDLSSNELQGSIPLEFKMLVNLEYLLLKVNHISGDIPSYLGDLQQLRELDLSHNKLTGRIPNAIGLCFRLEKIDLSYNSLAGNIPMEISSLHSLAFYLNFSYNSLTGRLPSLGGMQQIQAIDISSNKLSGRIPGDIGSCSGLQYLNLAKNRLEGMVPMSIGQLKSLESIDMSFNDLSGPVPPPIANLSMLRHLNFSYNNLSGSIPNQGAFRNLSATSFLANPGLCAGSGWLNLPNCTSSAKNHRALNRNIVLVTSIGTFLALCCILGAFYIFYGRTKGTPITNSLLGQGFMQISSQELHTATQGFSATNLLGNGSFGSVYKGVLSDNKMVAIKLFDQDPQNSYKHFVRECRVLRKIRHRNLVKVLSSSSTGDIRALVLEFMSQGSLEQHLHTYLTQCSLSLKMRVKIALDVAHGMAYLHHDCSPPIVHCDLKPSNVLFDETMTAHVADFGISRLLTSPVSASSSTSRLKGTVGYLAPEYGLGAQVSTKGDVYCFGILILEMVTKKRPTDGMFSGDVTLPRWVRRAFPEAVEGVVDRELLVDQQTEGESSSSATPGTTGEELESFEHGRCLVSLIGLGLQCTSENPGDRPTMREVEGMLDKMVYGRAYGNLEEHSSVQNLLSAGNRVHHGNSSTDESESS